MSLFCFLCIPLFCFFRRTISCGETNIFWALLLGGAAVALSYFTGPLIVPNGFGFSRWMSGFVDVVSLPALVPLFVCLLLVKLRIFSADRDYVNFALFWMIPLAVIHSINRNAVPSPLPLILVPTLWIALAVGIPFFVDRITRKPHWYMKILLAFSIVMLPVSAATSWWAFFSQRNGIGFLFLLTNLVPAVSSVMVDWKAAERNR